MATMISSDSSGFSLNAQVYEVKDGYVTVELETDGAVIVKSVERSY